MITEALNIENSRGEKPERTLTVHWSGSKVCDERAWNPGKERYSVVKQLVGAFFVPADFAFASHYLGEMGKAIIDDLLLAIQPGGPHT
ncbi:DUF3077 domain-containing protein [Pseudomonas simiae]